MSEEVKELVRDCYLDPVLFCRMFFPHVFVHPVPWFHRGLLALYTGRVEFLDRYGDLDRIARYFVWADGSPCFDLSTQEVTSGFGQFNCILLPPGMGATTLLGLVLPAWNLLYHEHKFTGYVKDSEGEARRQIALLRKQIGLNPRVLGTFGDQELTSATSTSPRGDFFETVHNHAIASGGYGTKIRSLSYDNAKPTMVFCDGIESRESTDGEPRRRRLRNWFYGEVMADSKLIYIDFLKHKESLAIVLARDPAWKVLSFPILLDDGPLWPDVMDEAAIESRRRSLALAGQEETFKLEYMNEVPGDKQTDFAEEMDRLVELIVQNVEVAALKAMPSLFEDAA